MSFSEIESVTRAVREHARNNIISVKEEFLTNYPGEIKNEWALDLLISFISDFETQPMVAPPGMSLEDIRNQNVQGKMVAAEKYVGYFYSVPRVKKHFTEATACSYKGKTSQAIPDLGFHKALEAGAYVMSIVEQRIGLEASILCAHANEHGISTVDPDRFVEENIYSIEPFGSEKAATEQIYGLMTHLEKMIYHSHIASTALRKMADSKAFLDKAVKVGLNGVLTRIIFPQRRKRGDPISKGAIDLSLLPQDIEAFDEKLFPLFYKFERNYASQRCANVYGTQGLIGDERVPRNLDA